MTALPATGLGRLPLIGFIARDIARDINVIFYMLTIVVTMITLAVMTWGVVALAMVALAMVPVMFCILIAITRG
ncbi:MULTISPECIES: hypothetical protein [Gemmobacter]|jgi:hypothetical protein|uniref:Uncharacterized protein n=2 Tax=Gemmobacter TaxID=204456 RepID=A0A2T6BBS0_9RHOB|nr:MULTISPECIES: hypothetical protein [Gemmobacter]OJY27409.1 MAG: hypothetical protein BGP11_15190 [Rhodobacterales bacterium 65-51]PTX53482.1 hypothetical protein C8N34_101399 [Gemmobacter caeni]TWJ05593.1 hypothetical protein IQ03_00397 [Gemmobacter caeni]GHC15047.1 hypothetical protein GCM10007291_11360 [Gemmobacter nanjingensis]